MTLQSFYPMLLTGDDAAASACFNAERMGFTPTFESDRYVSLRHHENPAYAPTIASCDHEMITGGFG